MEEIVLEAKTYSGLALEVEEEEDDTTLKEELYYIQNVVSQVVCSVDCNEIVV
jgi:hypothetical protein